jgi:hypothetical protein
MEPRGWRLREAWDVSSTPEKYRAYVQRSRGEFSCAKPAYVTLETAWVSDRTLCYLASGRPAVVQHTGRQPTPAGRRRPVALPEPRRSGRRTRCRNRRPALRRRKDLSRADRGREIRGTFTLSQKLCKIALRCGRAFGIDLHGVDIIESERKRCVVDVCSIPGFKASRTPPGSSRGTPVPQQSAPPEVSSRRLLPRPSLA